MKLTRLTKLGAVAAVAALALTGCGGSSSGGGETGGGENTAVMYSSKTRPRSAWSSIRPPRRIRS